MSRGGAPGEIRVLWLIKGLGAGGSERLLVAAARTHDRASFDLSLAYLLPSADQQVAELQSLDVPCTCLDVHNELDLRWMLRLRRLLRNSPVDVLHMHSPYAAGFGRVVARTLPRRLRPRLVTTEHNAWSTYRRPTRLINAASAPLDDAIVAVSDQARASLPSARRRKASTIAHGVPVDSIRGLLTERDSVRREMGIPAHSFLIGTVANYHRKKDWPTLLKAARIVADHHLDVRFLAVGHGPLEAEVTQLHRTLGLDEVVTLTGYRIDAVRLMAGADAFVLASKWEGLPVALMEACALGLPIVASSVGGIPEHFTDGVDSLLVEPGQPEDLAQQLLALATDDELRAKLAEASSARRHDFDARTAFARIEQIYEQVVSAERPIRRLVDQATEGCDPVRLARIDDAPAVAALHSDGLPDGFLVTLGPRFLTRLYRRIVVSPEALLLVTEDSDGITGFIAVAEHTGRLYREFLLHDGVPAALAAVPHLAKAPRHVWETFRYGTASDTSLPEAEVLAIAVAARSRGRGLGSALIDAGTAELTHRGVKGAHVVTGRDNAAAIRMYERAGFSAHGPTEVHRGVPQVVLVWP